MLHHDAEGRGALDDGAPARAVEAYAANRTLNVLEPWVAPYDEATALRIGWALEQGTDWHSRHPELP